MPRNSTTSTFLCSVLYVPCVIKSQWGRGEHDLSSAFGAVLSMWATLKFQFLPGWKLYKLNCFAQAIDGAVAFQTWSFLSSALPFFFYPSVRLQDNLLWRRAVWSLIAALKSSAKEKTNQKYTWKWSLREQRIGLYIMAQCKREGWGKVKGTVGRGCFLYQI